MQAQQSFPKFSLGSAPAALQHAYTALKGWQRLSCVSPKIRMSSLVVKSFGDMLNYFSDIIFTFFKSLAYSKH